MTDIATEFELSAIERADRMAEQIRWWRITDPGEPNKMARFCTTRFMPAGDAEVFVERLKEVFGDSLFLSSRPCPPVFVEVIIASPNWLGEREQENERG